MLRNSLVAALATIALSTNFAAAESAAGQYSAAEKDGFVLFPGGNQADALEWQKVIPNLSLPALAVEMPHGETANMTRTDYIKSVLNAIDKAGFRRAILVGHSGGGLIVPQIAIRAPQRVRHMVFLAANVPPEGGTVMDLIAFDPVAIATWTLGPKSGCSGGGRDARYAAIAMTKPGRSSNDTSIRPVITSMCSRRIRRILNTFRGRVCHLRRPEPLSSYHAIRHFRYAYRTKRPQT